MAAENFNNFKEGQVYPILGKYLNYRNFEADPLMSMDKLKDLLIKNRYVVINSKSKESGNEKHLVLVLFASDYKDSMKEQKILEIHKRISKQINIPSKFLEINFVGENKPSEKTIMKLESINCYYYLYIMFAIEYPICTQARKHRIMSLEEITEVMERLKLDSVKKLCQLICRDDVMVVWIGAKPGDVLEITEKSENTCESIYYRLVIPINTVNPSKKKQKK